MTGLTVNGSTTINSTNYIYFNDTNERIRSDGSNLEFWAGGGERMSVGGNGNVGIGTHTPGKTFEVLGTINSVSGTKAISINGGGTATGSIWTNTNYDPNNNTASWGETMIFNGGNVGIGKSPATKLHIQGNATNTSQPSGINNGSQDTHTGLFICSNGNANNEKYGIQFGGYDNYSHSGIFGNMDTTSGNTTGDITFDFRTSTGNTSLTEIMRITHEGRVGIGVASPSYSLHVTGDTYCTGNSYINSYQYFMNNTNYWILCNGNFYWYLAGYKMLLDGSGNLTTTGDITGYGSISDVRLKKNIINLDTSISLEKILKMRTVGFKWVDDLINEKRRGKYDEGLIAQEIEKIWPLLVDELQMDETDTPYKYIHYDKLTIYLTGAIQEHQKMIENQNKIIEQQQEMINNQQKMMEEFRKELTLLKQNI